MPQIYQGVEYLNTREAAEFIGVAFVTFMRMREKYSIPTYSIPGKGSSKFCKKSDLEALQAPQTNKPPQ